MIYTVTLNPSIDYFVQVKQLELGNLNKMEDDLKLPGGKGINVSRILHELSRDTTALGFLGGFTGEFIANWLRNDNIHTDFTPIQDETRINIKLKSEAETEINGLGPTISEEESEALLSQIDQITSGDILILSGSKPPALPDDYYNRLIERHSGSSAEFVIDTTGDDLRTALPYKPLLVKPNKAELAELFGVKMNNKEVILQYGEKLLEMGAKHAIVSMAGEGALLFTKTGTYQGISPTGTVKNSVGAGDSMIAGFVAEYTRSNDAVQSFKLGLAAGSATAFSSDLADRDTILSLLDQVEVTAL